MGNIPKIKPEERIKLIDVPELVVVQPLTHAASIRYGLASMWCTSTDSDDQFIRYFKRGMLLYALMFEVKDGKRVGDAKTKMALYRKWGPRAKWEVYDSEDDEFNYDIIAWMFDAKHDLTSIIEIHYEQNRGKLQQRKVIPNDYKVGQIVRGTSNDVIPLAAMGQWRYRGSYGRSRNKKWKNRTPNEQVRAEIRYSSVKKAEIYEVTQSTIKLTILELNNPSPILRFMLKTHGLKTSFRITQTPKFEMISSKSKNKKQPVTKNSPKSKPKAK